MTKAITLAISLMPPAFADWQINMNEGVTALSREIFDLHMLIFWICVVIGVAVFGVMFYSIFKFRKSKEPSPNTGTKIHSRGRVDRDSVDHTHSDGNPATATLMDMYDTSEADVEIQVTGYQWKWRYQYLDEDIDFFEPRNTS